MADESAVSALRAYRKRKKLSQGQLAELVGVNKTLISAIERGAKRPGLDTAFAIERATGIAAKRWVLSEEKAA